MYVSDLQYQLLIPPPSIQPDCLANHTDRDHHHPPMTNDILIEAIPGIVQQQLNFYYVRDHTANDLFTRINTLY